MELTSAQCRIQEAIQLARAKSEPLENVRKIALKAAVAWRYEAEAAELREARRLGARSTAELKQFDRERIVDDGEKTVKH